MKYKTIAAMMFMLVGCSAEQIANPGQDSREKKNDRYNILFILVDDLGKEWTPLYEGENIAMPHLEKLASGGVIFNNAYVNPQCTPTRVSLLTGQYPFRHGWVNHWDTPRWGHGYYDWRTNPSIARIMQSAGYKTAAAGKWQINDFRLTPDAMEKHGFDDYLMWTGYESGVEASAERYWNPYLHSKVGSRTYAGAFGEDMFSDFLIDFIEKHREEPWFVYYPMVLPHVPFIDTPDEKNAEDPDAQFRAMVRYTDTILGRFLTALDRLDERKQTIIFWVTDNGSEPGLVGFRNGRGIPGSKALTTEAGINVPFVVSAPAMAHGVQLDALVDITDILPTLATLAGEKLPENFVFDGMSFASLLTGKSATTRREWIMAMGGQNRARVSDGGVENEYIYRDRVLRDKRYKLYIKASPEQGYEKLVDLWRDPDEQVNLLTSDDPYVKIALARLSAAAATFPDKDNDPKYIPRKANLWDVPVTVASQSWKK